MIHQGHTVLSVYSGIGGCVGDTSYYTVKIEECSSLLFIPNTFTPDGDGSNEVFQATGLTRVRISYDYF